jgi:hypothetical protein
MNVKIRSIIALTAMVAAMPLLAQRKLDKPVPVAFEPQIKQFFAAKKAQAKALAKIEDKELMPEVWDFFAAGENGDWASVASIYRKLRRGAYQYEGTKTDPRLVTMAWQPINECYGAYEQGANMDEKYVTKFAREILDSIPRGSIYFGGTDPGRWLPTAFSKSHVKADPCFILTQNALADNLYLQYIQAMYGDRIKLLSTNDSSKAFDEYTTDAGKRLKEGKLKPGENVRDVDGKVQVSGQVAVMAINARLAQMIFDANPRKEFFIEESFPLDWMYPHLSPNSLIMKLNREPLAEMPDDVVQKDQKYWTQFINGALGKWLTPTTSVEVVCDFAERVFEQKEQEPFQPDEKFVRNDYACKTYSKLRSSQAGVYAWRATNGKSPAERKRMETAADLAFRQAFAMCPYSPEAVFRYVNLLQQQKRTTDALLVAQAAARLDPRNVNFENLIAELQRLQKEQ